MYRALFTSLLLLASGPVQAGEIVEITTCDQEVPRGGVGILQNDLVCPTAHHCEGDPMIPCATSADCPGGVACEAPYAVELKRAATLRLNSHSIVGGYFAVRCEARCSVEGPGDISGASYAAVSVYLKPDRINLTNLSLHHNTSGTLQARVLNLVDVDLSNNTLRGIELTRLVKGTNVTASGNGLQGIFAERVRVQSLTATGNGAEGVIGVKGLKLESSTVTGNDAAGAGVDIVAGRRPRLIETTCGRSASFEDGTPWGVCASD